MSFPFSLCRTLNSVFTLVLMLMVIINTVNMGSQLDLDVIKEVFKKPIGPAVGFASQFVVMPVVSCGFESLCLILIEVIQ